MIEEKKILSINSHKTVHRVFFPKMDQKDIIAKLFAMLKEKELSFPQILSSHVSHSEARLLLTGEGQASDYQAIGASRCETVSSVTMTCHGSVSSDLLPNVLKTLSVPVLEILQDSTNLTVIVEEQHREKAIKDLHTLLGPA